MYTEHFASVYKDRISSLRTKEHWDMVYPISRPSIPECRYDLAWLEVLDVLGKLRKGKSSGNDDVPIEVYKCLSMDEDCSTPMGIAIFTLLEKVFSNSDIPTECDHSILVPVPKKGDHKDVNSYRPIALMNTLLKVLCKVVTNRLNQIVERYHLISQFQAGFRTREECVAQVTTLLECLQRRSRVGKTTLVCFHDFAKAYDSVPHTGLLRRLESLGFCDKMLGFIRGLYKNPTMKVRLIEELGQSFPVEVGVRQGCPLSPMLFNLYINDMFEGMVGVGVPGISTSVPGLMFADDTTLLAESLDDLNSNLRILEQWCTSRGMMINASKCGLMYINHTENGAPVSIFGETIPIVESYQYLGIKFTNTLDLKGMVTDRVRSGREALRKTHYILNNREVPILIRRSIVTAVIAPIALYGCEVWGMSMVRCRPAGNIIDQAIRILTGYGSNFARRRVYEELNILPAYVKSGKARTRAWLKWGSCKTLISQLINSL